MGPDRDQGWLWRGTEAVERRRRKAGGVIAAVAQVLEEDNPVGETALRFSREFARFQAFSPATRARLIADPYAYYWGRLAFELLQLVLRPEAAASGIAAVYLPELRMRPHEALARHLGDFGRLLLGGAVLDGIDAEPAQPLEVVLPFALPGTPLCLNRPAGARVRVSAARGGELVASGPANREAFRGEACAVARFDGGAYRLQPPVFNVIASGISMDIAAIDPAYQVANAARVCEAMMLMRDVDPESFGQVCHGLEVVALRPPAPPGSLSNLSHCDLPGAVALHPYSNPYECCNILLHEFLHNRLFALEEEGWFFDPRRADGEGLFSPWRTDYRPPHGLLHAAFVFTGVGRYWLRVATAETTPGPIRDIAKTRVLSGLYQVRIALAQLRRHGGFTDSGSRVMDLLEQNNHELRGAADGIGIGSDLPHMTFSETAPAGVEMHERTVRGVVQAHLRRYARDPHKAELERLIA